VSDCMYHLTNVTSPGIVKPFAYRPLDTEVCDTRKLIIKPSIWAALP
jgi:hypothetical protein